MTGRKDGGRYISEDQRRAINGLFASLPHDYEHFYAALQELREQFQRQLATAYEPSLRKEVARASIATPSERRDLAWSIRHSVESLGLKTMCPRTGQPAVLLAPEAVDGPRFVFSVFDPSQGLENTSSTFDQLPPLSLGLYRAMDSDHIPQMFRGLNRSGSRDR